MQGQPAARMARDSAQSVSGASAPTTRPGGPHSGAATRPASGGGVQQAPRPARPQQPGGGRGGGGGGRGSGGPGGGGNRDTRLQMDPVEKARRQMGYKNNWHRKEVDHSNQVRWPEPLVPNPRVAIIGGGMSGLMCARELARLGIRSTVFDTGKHGVGGRMGTRASGEASLRSGTGTTAASTKAAAAQLGGLVFDHAAQFFTVTDPSFQSVVDDWLATGLVRVWDGPVGTLRAGGSAGGAGAFAALPPRPPRYVAVGGMRRLAEELGEALEAGGGGLVEFRRPCWVGKMQAEEGRGWALSGEGRSQGVFDAVVVAHNGKCANRLVGPTGAPKVAEQLMRLKLNAVWCLMVAFDGPLPVNFEGAFVQGSPVLSWAANNTAKLELRHTPAGTQCWTLFSTNAYGQANKVPQENIPPEVADKVAAEMVAALREAVGGPEGSPTAAAVAAKWPKTVFTRVQLWGAALPLNTPGTPCILDPDSRVGVCGDWLSGGSLQAAAVSGITLARQIAGLRGKTQAQLDPFRLGLEAQFRPLRATDIGEFPH
ncbi:hypothetical protein HYH02_014928 [Chlamydomonas schloesseri]|uniref:Amine oxidase domain-containing protein n=1 Tax=Chlamydomonas schloesseri TaxID=2026947 RepID=A0A835VUC9_9CHLO|nr:hypothetical protein HYH02_014928 [Chlamydomonas schloesseri]|eukprot:KAG2425864.1 hypothetical protein HYH02_014928 [Chlamydomonas schloesseri]